MGACGSKQSDDAPAANVHQQKNVTSSPNANQDAKKQQIASFLKNVPLLSKLLDSERTVLANAMKERTYQMNDTLIVEGEDGHEFYIIKSGRASVSKRNPESGINETVAELKPGDYCGEAAILGHSKRGATVTAIDSQLVVYYLEQKQFESLFGKSKLNIVFGKRAAISAETTGRGGAAQSSSATPNQQTQKSPEQTQRLLKAVASNILFQNLSSQQQSQIINQMWLQTVDKGSRLIRQGDTGDYFFVVEAGLFEIYVDKNKVAKGNVGYDETRSHMKVATRGPGTSFGELALMYNAPRAATVIASEDSIVWTVDRWTFRNVLQTINAKKMKEYEQFLRGVQSFEVLLENERSKVAEALEEIQFPAGSTIVRQGEAGDVFFIVKSGEVVCTQVPEKGGAPVELTRYHAGNTFAERALLLNEPRAATCTAVSDVVCLYLHRDAFTTLLGSLEDIFKERVNSYTAGGGFDSSAQSSSAGGRSPVAQRQSIIEDTLDHSIKFENLKVLGTLGKGSFGHVQLVIDRTTGETYALKSVAKQQVVELGQQEHLMSEKRVMAALKHPFLIRLCATFKNQNQLFFLLEPSLGGELFTVLRAKTYFDFETARFYAAGVVLAFEYMHSKGIIYRDLKPENLLLDAQGYLKITDFGFAKRVGDERTFTLCGTPDYLAPEIVSGAGHNKGADWWTLGVLIFEMLASYPPFYDEDPMQTYAKIMQGHIAFPMHFSKHSVDLIKRLLHPKPVKRLGVIAGGATLIKQHPFFAGFPWDDFLNRRLKAPIILPVKDKQDMSNFESYGDDDNSVPVYRGDPKHPNWDEDF